MRTLPVLIAALAVLSASCATAPTRGQNTADQSMLTAEEITAAGVTNAYDAVDRLRPRWKRDYAAPESAGEVVVYMDNRSMGGLEALRDIAAREVREMQYLNGADALMRWGPEASGGAIMVVRQ